ncbi:MAG: hypothetical protein Q4A16_10010 [Lautropia sp.]|nr:hypothetical protein [Lautropia sp.]
MYWQIILILTALGIALSMRPWRLLRGGALLTPMLATLVLLPWLWALPRLHIMPVHLQWSGACLVVLTLGWPLAVPVLCGVGLLSAVFAPQPWPQVIDSIVWLGMVPATFALLLGAGLRRLFGEHLFIYILGRAFLGTVLCLFISGALAQWSGQRISAGNNELESMVARWLLAWGDGFMTGMAAAIFVAFKPEWLATWSDRLYLKQPVEAEPPAAPDEERSVHHRGD